MTEALGLLVWPLNQIMLLNEEVAVFRLELYLPESDGAVHNNGQGLCNNMDGSTGRGSYQVRGLRLTFKQFFALLIKRLHHTTRSYKDFVAQVM